MSATITDSHTNSIPERKIRSSGRIVISPWAVLVIRRLLLAIPQLFIVTSITFLLASLAPGDPARAILGLQASQEQVDTLRKTLGLNLPIWEQYSRWLVSALQGNFGVSISSHIPVSTYIVERLPVTLSLVICGLLVTGILGIALGVFTSLGRGASGKIVDWIALIGYALPGFWLASGLVAIFAVKLGWFPAVGYTSLASSPAGWFRSLILPVAALSLAGVALVARQTREAMTGVMSSEYVRMARAHGVSSTSLILRYGLRNAAIPVVTIIGVQFIGLLAGTVFIEQVFALPGLGSLLTQSAIAHDLPVLQGITVVFTAMVILVNLIIDVLYAWLNPKLRTR